MIFSTKKCLFYFKNKPKIFTSIFKIFIAPEKSVDK